MATTVDIIVRAKDSQLDRLQKKMERLGKVTKSADNAINALDKELTKLGTNAGMEAAIRDIDIYKGKLAQARQATKALAREKVSPRIEGGSASGGGGGGGGAAALGGFALLNDSVSKQFKTSGKEFEKSVGAVKKELRESAQFSEKISDATDRVEIANGKIADQFKKQSQRATQIENAQKKLNAATGQQKKLQNAIKSGRIKEKEAVKRTKIEIAKLGADMTGYKNEIKSANAAIRQHKNLAEGLAPEFADAKRELLGMEESLERQARTVAKQRARSRRKGAIAQSAGAGLAFANIPGQDIFQAAAAGRILGGKTGAAVAGLTAGIALLAVEIGRVGKQSAVAFSEISRFQLALENVAGDRYTEALQAISRAVEDFNIPLVDATQNFTQLLAAADSADFSLSETEQTFRALAAANKALGGDAEKLRGILLATTQVFSKGRVSAEELRGQIGERLAGAFADFATASGISTAELDKNLERGQVTLRQFVQFAQFLLKKYEEDSKVIADGPDEAGARLKTALDNLLVQIGPTLRDLGAGFQDFAAEAVKSVGSVIEQLGKLGRKAEQALGGADALQALRNAEAWRDSIQSQLLDPNTSAKRVEELKQFLGLAEKTVKEAQARLDSLKLGPPVPSIRKDSTVTEDPPDFTTQQQQALRDALSASDRAVDLELSKALLRLEEKRLEALMAQDEEQVKKIDKLKVQGRAVVGIQKAEERIRILQETAAGLTDKQLEQSGIANQLAVERNKLGIAFNDAERVGLELRQESTIELQQQIDKMKELVNEAIRLTGVQPVIDPKTGSPTAFVPPEQTFADSRRDELARLKTADDEFSQILSNVKQLMGEGMSFNDAFELEESIRNARKLKEETELFEQKMEDLQKTISQSLANALETALVETITAAVRGADDLNEKLQAIASSLLSDLGRMFIRAGINGLGSALDIPGFANGGVVEPNSLAIVGEKGPELLINGPGATRVIPNHDIDAFGQNAAALAGDDNVVTTEESEEASEGDAFHQNNQSIHNTAHNQSSNSTAGNTSSSAFSQNSESLIQQAFAINQSTISNQNQMLSQESAMQRIEQTNFQTSPIDVRFEEVVINEQRFTTAEETKRATMEAAQKGRDMALAALKNSVRARRQVGLS